MLRILMSLLVIAALGATAPVAHSQTYPERPVRLVVGFAPGGGADVVARIVASRLPDALGQPVIVENRPGATGTIAANAVAKSRPDGYTLLVGAVSTNSIAPSLYSNLSYDSEKDLTGIGLLASLPNMVAIYPGLPIHSLKELIAYAKSNPGKLTFASAGNGSTPHLAGELFKMATGTDLVHVPYKGAAQALPDLVTGKVSVSFDTTGTIIGQLKAGKLRALAIAAPKRFPGLPDVPTAAEAGLPGYEVSTWIGLFAPTGTPQAVIEKLHASIMRTLRYPEIQERLRTQLGSDDSTSESPEAFNRLVQSDTARYAKVIHTLNIKVD